MGWRREGHTLGKSRLSKVISVKLPYDYKICQTARNKVNDIHASINLACRSELVQQVTPKFSAVLKPGTIGAEFLPLSSKIKN